MTGLCCQWSPLLTACYHRADEPARTHKDAPLPVNPIASEKEAQAAFADVYDGDYAFMDLYDRDDLRAGLAYLYAHHRQAAKPEPVKRRATFRAADGQVAEVSRSVPRVPDIASVSLHDVVVIVRNGRVEGFTGPG